jgi:hypothetical protein
MNDKQQMALVADENDVEMIAEIDVLADGLMNVVKTYETLGGSDEVALIAIMVFITDVLQSTNKSQDGIEKVIKFIRGRMQEGAAAETGSGATH